MTDHNESPDSRFIVDVERLRRKRGLSIRDLATRSGLNLEEVDDMLRRGGKLPLDAVILLAQALEVPPGKLIDGTAELAEDS